MKGEGAATLEEVEKLKSEKQVIMDISVKTDQKLEKAHKKIRELEQNLATAEGLSKKYKGLYEDLKPLAGLEEQCQELNERCSELMVRS